MKPFTIREALSATGGIYHGPQEALDQQILFVTSDSRRANTGALFVAFKGARADGHSFMAGCLKSGAVCCLSERAPQNADEEPMIEVDSTLAAEGRLAAWYRKQFDIPVIGITGSVGKTTTKEMISAVLNRKYRTHKTQMNYNNELGVPRTILAMPEDAQTAVVEMGISDFGEMTRLTRIVHPKIAVITMIGDAHLEFLHDRKGVLRAKTEIFGTMDENCCAILNGDDENLRTYTAPCKTVTYGREPGNDFVADNIRSGGEEGMHLRISHHGGSFDAYVPAFGIHITYAALAAAACGWLLGLTDAEIAEGLSEYVTVGNRSKIIDTGSIRIVSDCYNANPNSVASAAESLCALEGRKVCVLGDMLELGENTKELHYGVGKKVAELGVDLVIACGPLSENTCRGARDQGINAYWFAEKTEAYKYLPELIRKGDNVLIKASHSMAFEEFIPELEKV